MISGKDPTTLHVETHLLGDDGLVPNNPRLPLLIYRSAVPLTNDEDPANRLERLFREHGWRGSWVNGIYPFHHYHARSHEVLGIAAGRVTVQFGGASGPELTLGAGDVVVIPAGVGHCRRSSDDGLVVVGAYPRGQEDYDLKRANVNDHAQALDEIARVGLPEGDPVEGREGPLSRFWR
jgi:uncharacterized protein YjlB